MAVRKGSSSPIQIGPAKYWIGDDAVQNASPRHVWQLSAPVWIDRYPLTLADLENCIAAGRFKPTRLERGTRLRPAGVTSVDSTYRLLVKITNETFSDKPLSSNLPVCGLSWQEAGNVCSFFGARLPTEFEWEVATKTLKCKSLAGRVQEWTASEWTARYWPGADRSVIGTLGENDQISVRGCLSMVGIASFSARMPVDRGDGELPRVFRRVWQQPPHISPHS
jgi:formylglycine-generating enzyme required for sulfatase activity